MDGERERLEAWARQALIDTLADVSGAFEALTKSVRDLHKRRIEAMDMLRTEYGMTIPKIAEATGISEYRLRQMWRDHNRRMRADLERQSSPGAPVSS